MTVPKPTTQTETETERVLKFLSEYKKLDPMNKEILKSVMNEKRNELTEKKGT